jgi:hypothetical protein
VSLTERINNANALGVSNLIKKGVEIEEGATTYDVMRNIAHIVSGEEERKRFWDAFTNNNTMTNYTNAFQNQVGANKWNNQTFKPPYKLVATLCNNMFENFNRARFTDIATITPDIVDFSNCTEAKSTFRNATVSPLVVDFSNVTLLSYTFATDNGGQMKETTIKVTEKLTSASNAFLHNQYGASFTDDSVIACSISFAQSSALSKTALDSIINALATVTTAQTLTLHSGVAVSDEQKATIQNKGWTLVQ